MSYFTAVQIGKALSKARVSAGLSQREIAIRIQKGERTVQSWEKGDTSPDSDEIMDWCAACGVSPISVFMEMFHPDLYKVPDDGKADDELNAELSRLVVNLPPLTKRLLLFILKGSHGSSPPAVISEIAANLHCPLNNRVSVCGTIIDQYSFAQIRGLDPCPDEPHPPMEDLKINYKSGRAASENGALGYIGRRKE
jgi:transcriptional regulator with XRE-family HTH domain